MEKCIHRTWPDFNKRKKIVWYKNNLSTNSSSILFTIHTYYAVVYAFPLRKDFLIPIFVKQNGKLFVCQVLKMWAGQEKLYFNFKTPQLNTTNIQLQVHKNREEKKRRTPFSIYGAYLSKIMCMKIKFRLSSLLLKTQAVQF